MTSITDITVDTDHRAILAAVAFALAAATISGALAIAASPGACAVTDPIHATITAHVSALGAFDIAAKDCEHNIDGLRSPEEQRAVSDAAYRACRISIGAAIDVAALAPTTEAGRQALVDHLLVARYRGEVENGHRINAYTARTGERFAIDG